MKKTILCSLLLLLMVLSIFSVINIGLVNAEEEHTIELWVDSFTHAADDWELASGTEPWLDQISGKRYTRWIFADPNVMNLTSFTFQNLPLMANFSIVSINLTICYADQGQMFHYFGLHNGTWQDWVNYPTVWQSYPYTNWTSEISDYYDSISAINNAKIKFMVVINSTNRWVYLYACWLTIVYTGTAGSGEYDISTFIRINGYVPYTNVTFQINAITYADSQTATLAWGDHTLDGTPVTHLSFINWTLTGDLDIDDSADPTTTLYVMGSGTLTLHLNATVAITHDETTITNMNADTWLFSEYRWYNFQTDYILTNSYLDTTKWSFLDFALHNMTFYYDNATTEAVLSGSNYILLRGNGTYTYSWLNLTSQTLTVKVWVWIKHYIIDTLYVDLYVYGNCSGYGMTNSTANGGYWTTAEEDYFNIYCQGGAEELTIGVVTGGMVEDSSVAAGRSEGGDIFNLYAYNDTFALSEQYWRHLVQVKLLFEFKWDYGYAGGYPWDSPSADFPIDLHYQLGWTYYARGNWCENRFSRIDLKLLGFGYGADYQFSKWDIKIVHGGVQVYDDTLFGWFDEASDSYKVWMDLWFNSANASSIAGARVTSYWYGVENGAPWWARVFTGNDWGIMRENQTSHLAFGMLRDEDVYTDRIFSSEIELVKLWCRVYQSETAYNYSASIWKIEIFDKVYDPHTMGIPTPPYEPPRTPSMPIGGFLGVIYAALMWIAEQLGAGVLTFWRVFVDFMDVVFTWAGWPGGFTQIILWIQSSFGWMISAFEYLISILTSMFSFLVEVGGKSTSFLSQVVTQWIAMIRVFVGFLDGAYTAGINIWNDLGLTSWLMLGAILYPLYLLILWDEEGIEAVITQLKFILDVLAMVAQGFISIIQLGLKLISTLVEAIPVVE